MSQRNRYSDPSKPVIGNVSPPLLTIDDVNETDREILQKFARRLTVKTESYLPKGFHIETGYIVNDDVVTLDVRLFCPFDAVIQNQVQITTVDADTDDTDMDMQRGFNSPDSPPTSVSLQFRSESGVKELSQQLTAVAAQQAHRLQQQGHRTVDPHAA